MKKYLSLALVAFLLFIPLVGTSTAEFTHAVFAEYASTTTCGYCPATSAALYAIYQSGDYPFYYVSLVANKNTPAAGRCGHYNARYVPSVFIDGGFKNITGGAQETTYRSLIRQCGERTVHSLGIEISATGSGDGKIQLTVKVKNNGSFFYLGGLITYITEITSRWNDASGHPYHYACLDVPIKRPLVLLPKGSRTFTVTWDGAANGFDTINDENIMIISSVCHWMPHQEAGYENSKFTAFYVDQTAGALVNAD
jgi:glutaredoxin